MIELSLKKVFVEDKGLKLLLSPLVLIVSTNFLEQSSFLMKSSFQSIFFFSKIFLNGNFFLFTKNLFYKSFKLSSSKLYYVLVRLSGLGYRAWGLMDENSGKSLILDLGYSHYVSFSFNLNISFVIRRDKLFFFTSEPFVLSRFVGFFRKLRSLNPYSLKGIKIARKVLFRKLKKKDRVR